MNKKVFASLMLGFATMLWGLAYTIQSISAAHLQTYTIVFFKGIGAICIIPLIIILKQKFNRYTFIGGIAMGVCAFLGCVFQQKGIVISSVSKASFITVLYIVIVPLIQLFFHQKLQKRMIMAICIALIGLYFLCISGHFTINIGDIYLLICSFFFACQIMIIDHVVKKCDSVALCFVAQMTTAILSAILMFIYEKPQTTDITNAILPILFIVFLSGALAQTIQIVYQGYLNPSLASLIMSFESVVGALAGWLILHQTLSFKEILGCVLVFVAILIAE